MSVNQLSAGSKAPDLFNVLIEISANSDPVKYEFDKDTGFLMVDRFLSTPMHYPCNYGFIPNTLCDDGDPADVCVLSPFPITPNALVTCRPLGVLTMEDEKGMDDKILAVPDVSVAPMYAHFNSLDDVPTSVLEQIGHFFARYKDLEANKWAKVKQWHNVDHAKQIIRSSIDAVKAD